METIEIKKIKYTENLNDLKYFFETKCEISTNFFSYFKTRSYECIKNHLVTNLMYFNNIPVGYSHLDKEDKNVWFGICIADSFKGKKFGEKLTVYTLSQAAEYNVHTVSLSVYRENLTAINLYKKLGFSLFDETDKSFFMKKEI